MHIKTCNFLILFNEIKKFLLLIIKINVLMLNLWIFCTSKSNIPHWHTLSCFHPCTWIAWTCINVMNFAFELSSLLKWRIIHLLGVFLWVVSMCVSVWVLLQFYNQFIKISKIIIFCYPTIEGCIFINCYLFSTFIVLQYLR